MTIREATPNDLDRCVEMGLRFLRDTEYRGAIAENPVQMRDTAAQLIESPQGALFVAANGSDVIGMIGVLAYTHPLSGQSMASELFWWVDPGSRGSGLRLLRRAEQWAIASGAVALQMIAPTPQVARLYQRLGFSAVETMYQRALA